MDMSNITTTMLARKQVFIPLGAVAIFLIVFPLFGGPYYEHIFILVFLNVVLAMSYRVPYVTGAASFCHVSFFAIGAYTSAIMVMRLGVPWGVGFIAGGLLAAGLAALFAWPAIRARGAYFFIVSFGFFMIVDMVISNWESMTGGRGGMVSIPPIAGFESVTPYYYVTLAVAAAIGFILWRLDRSRFGRELMAIGDSEDLVEACGINVDRHKLVAFSIGAFFAGLAGSIFGHYMGFISPANFGMFITLYILIWVIVGGERKFWGPIAGASIMTLAAEGARVSGRMQAIIYAVILLVVIMAMPRGLVGLVDTLRTWRAVRVSNRGANGNP